MRYWKWKIVIKFLILSLIFNISNAQNINEKPFKLFSKSEKIEIDQYGFIYHINKDNLIKFNLKGVPLYNYSNKLLGAFAPRGSRQILPDKNLQDIQSSLLDKIWASI